MPARALKDVARSLLPPVVTDSLRRLNRRRRHSEWEWYDGRPVERSADIRGWDERAVAEAYRRRWQGWTERLRSTDALAYSIYDDERVLRYDVQHQNVTVGWVMSLAAGQRDHLSVLDWGGGVGQLAAVARELRPDLRLDWVVHDVPTTVSAGAELCPDVTFSDDQACFDRQYDLVIAKGSLQYAPDWASALATLARASTSYVYVSETPFVETVPSYAMVQRPQWAWDTEYVGWAIRRSEFVTAAREAGLEVVHEIMGDYRPEVANAPEQPLYWGYLLRTRAANG